MSRFIGYYCLGVSAVVVGTVVYAAMSTPRPEMWGFFLWPAVAVVFFGLFVATAVKR